MKPQPRALPALLLAAMSALSACKGDKGEGRGPAATGQKPAVPAARDDVAPSGAGAIGAKAAEVAPLPADPGGAGGTHAWSVRMGGVEADSGRDVAVDPGGGVYAVGTIRNVAEVGATTLEARALDGVLTRLSADGTVEWAVRMGGDGDDIASAVAVDPSGSAVVTGWFSGSLELGDGSLESKGSDDLFIAAVNPQGKRLWAHRFGGADSDGGDGVAVDAGGNIAVIGSYRSEIEVGRKAYPAAGNTDILLLVLGPDGAVKWSRTWGAVGPDEGRAVGFDAAGNLYVLVEFSRAVDFGGGPLTSSGNRDMAVIKLGPDGSHLWSRRFGAQLDELALGLVVDPSGSAIVTGSFDDVLDMGTGEPMRTLGRSDVFVAKLGPDGTTHWARRLGEKDEDIGAAVATDRFGNVYATGWYWKSLEHGGKSFPSKGKKEAFLMVFSPAGEPLWGRTFGQKEDDYLRGIALNDTGIFLVGTYHVGINLGGEELVAKAAERASIPYGDIFVAKLAR